MLFSHFKSPLLVGQIMINIPLALIASVVAVLLTGGTFSIASLVGFITLTGIASRYSTLRFFNQLTYRVLGQLISLCGVFDRV